MSIDDEKPTVLENFVLTHVSLNKDGSFGIGGYADCEKKLVLKKRTPGEQRAYWDGMKGGIDSAETHGIDEARKMLEVSKMLSEDMSGELRPPLVDLSSEEP